MTNQSRMVYFNGEMVPEKEAKLSIYDSALMFGDLVFEMTRSFSRKHFKLREHLERLYSGCKYLRIPLDMPIEEMEQACHQVAEANASQFDDDDEHRLIIDVTRGTLSFYQDVDGAHLGTNVIIADFPLKWAFGHFDGLYEEGLQAVVPSQRQIPARLLEPKVKSRNRIHYLMSNIETAHYEGRYNMSLLLDPEGFVTESPGANFFIVKDETLYTPEPRNILRGISRAYVMEMCKELGIECFEKNLEVYDVVQADEAFFTNTPFCMMPTTRIQGVPIGTGKIGPIFYRLINKWSENVGMDIVEQTKRFAAEDAARPKKPAPSIYNFRG